MKRIAVTKAKKMLFLALIYTIMHTLVVHAQNQEYIVDNLKVIKDFPSSLTISIFKDSKGFMWFGTINGLYRYDGYTFKSFTEDPNDSSTISGNYITQIFEDNKGMIWVGTTSGLNKFNRAHETFKILILCLPLQLQNERYQLIHQILLVVK